MLSPGGFGEMISIDSTKGLTQSYMSLLQFQQIRGTSHPEDRYSGDAGDKAFQMHHLLNVCNESSCLMFNIPTNLTLNKGSIGMCSQYCPFWMYNTSKPKKFCVDLWL